MQVIKLSRGEKLDAELLKRSGGISQDIVESASAIIADVRKRGDKALFEYTARFDGVEREELRISDQELIDARSEVDTQLIDSLERAAERIRDFHERQLEQSWFNTRENGALVGSLVQPLERVGIYVPGGRAVYPSTVLMNAVPASVAGVDSIVMCVPPRKDGSIDPACLVAAQIAGVDEVYAVGGAQAIAALAYGTESIQRVDKITGPGNAYVAAAKGLVQQDVAIDMIAGPSEVLVLADKTAEPALVAIDLMAQAEHDPLSACYVVTTDPELPDLLANALEVFLARSPRADVTRQSLDNNGRIIVCESLEDALDATNYIAPEHLEILMESPFDLLGSIRNAGAIFLGPWTPEAVGDYIAGLNHTLPTSGTARFSSPLSVSDFQKRSSVISYSWVALAEDADDIERLARHEGLWAHAESIAVRMVLPGENDGEDQQEGEA